MLISSFLPPSFLPKLLILLLGLTVLSCQPRLVENAFYVEGNCLACKQVIEEQILYIAGVKEANWNFQTSFLTISYMPNQISLEQAQQLLAKCGFTTQFYPPNDSARNLLPPCCQQPIERDLELPSSKNHSH